MFSFGQSLNYETWRRPSLGDYEILGTSYVESKALIGSRQADLFICGRRISDYYQRKLSRNNSAVARSDIFNLMQITKDFILDRSWVAHCNCVPERFI